MDDLVRCQGFQAVAEYFCANPAWALQKTDQLDTFLHLACRHNRQDLVAFILSNSLLVNSCNAGGNTALHIASESGYAEIVSSLLAFKADPAIANISGDFAIHLAVMNLQEAVIDEFLSFKVDLNMKNQAGETILHLLVDLNCSGLVEKVVKLGFELDLNAQDKDGWTALHLACRVGHVLTVQTLVKLGARTDLLSVRGESVISVALRHGNVDSLQVLLDAQAAISENDLKVAREACKPSLWKALQERYKSQMETRSRDQSSFFSLSSSKSDTLDSLHSVFFSPGKENYLKLLKNHSSVLENLIIPDVPSDQIQVESLIGRGEHAEVYQGVWRNSRVALKKFFKPQDFLMELEVLGSIRHPNVVLLMAMSTQGSMLLTEFMELGSLTQFLASDVELSLKQKLSLALDILEGLVFLHSSSPAIIHRDLKPANCLVDRSFRCKIGDFGLARLTSASFNDSEVLGTASYMSPEVISSQKYSTKSDIYSFGVMFWEILYRKPPYQGLATVQVLFQVVHQSCLPPWSLSPVSTLYSANVGVQRQSQDLQP